MTSCHPRTAQRAFSEISGSFYRQDMAMKLLRRGPVSGSLDTSARCLEGRKTPTEGTFEGIRGTWEYLYHVKIPPLTRTFFGHSSTKHLLEAATSTAQLSSPAGDGQGNREGDVGWFRRD